MKLFFGDHMVNLGELAEAVSTHDGLLSGDIVSAMTKYGFEAEYVIRLLSDFILLDFGYWTKAPVSGKDVLRLTEAGKELAVGFFVEFTSAEDIPQNRI